MKASSAHVALLAILMYGLLSVSYVYAQAKKSSPPTGAAASAPAQPPSSAPGMPAGAGFAFGGPGAEPSPWEYRTIRLDHADAASLSQQLKELVSTCDMVGDVRTNQIIIHGTKEGIETVLSLVKQLDVPDSEKPPVPRFIYAVPGGLSTAPLPSLPSLNTTYFLPKGAVENLSPDLSTAWQDYANLDVGGDEPVKQEVLKQRELLDRLQQEGNFELSAKLLAGIDHLLHEQARRANENAARAKDQADQAAREVQKAEAASDAQQQQVASYAHTLAEQARRTAEQARRTTEQLQRALKGIEVNERGREEARRTREVDQRIAVLAMGIHKLAATSDLSDKQKAALDNARLQLKDQLSTQFDERQNRETEELKQLRQRLDKLEKEISDRAQNRDNLINRRLDDLVSASDSSGHGTVTLTGPAVTLEDVQGASTIQFKLDAPGAIKITRPVPPAKVNVGAALPSEPAMPASATVDGIQVQADSTPQPAEGAGTEDPVNQQPKAPQR